MNKGKKQKGSTTLSMFSRKNIYKPVLKLLPLNLDFKFDWKIVATVSNIVETRLKV